MSFLKTFSIHTEKTAPFPYNIPAIRLAKSVDLDNPVTVFVGDNGTGKSTLLESIGYKVNLPLIGGYIEQSPGFEAAKQLESFIDIEWRNQTTKGFFFRAEDFSDFIKSIENERRKLAGDFMDLYGLVDEKVIAQMNDSNNYALQKIRKDYGEDMQAFSHGEAYIKIMQTRIGDKGIYLLDEPEAALSPLKQLSLIAYILEVLKTAKAQFIIATHSPILMGIPGAVLYEITQEEMCRVSYHETEHYQITKRFLDDPEFYLRHLK